MVGTGLLDRVGELVHQREPHIMKLHVVSDSNVWPLYGDRLLACLTRAGFSSTFSVVQAGESSKSMTMAENVAGDVARAGLSRSDGLVALGGGVVGDLTGFIASLLYRGMKYIGLPTSFLAQVDSGVGGKTGVNASFGKNMLGTFHQPALVVADATVLKTLPAPRLLDGLAEAIKTAAVADAGLFASLQKTSLPITETEFVNISATCLKTKAMIVENDEKDLGQRMLLNYGHTLGHALEAAGDFLLLSHGEAVALGMRAFASLGEKMRISTPGTAGAINGLLDRHGLPDRVVGLSLQTVLEFAGLDKKSSKGQFKVVFIKQPGEGILLSLQAEEYRRIIEEAFALVVDNG
jgi:3-dehydroquinate synthase